MPRLCESNGLVVIGDKLYKFCYLIRRRQGRKFKYRLIIYFNMETIFKYLAAHTSEVCGTSARYCKIGIDPDITRTC